MLFALSSAGCASFSNYLFRRSNSTNSNAQIYLIYYYALSLIASLFIRPDILTAGWHPLSFLVGCCIGFLNLTMMQLTATSLRYASVGITFAAQNASSVFTTPILYVVFGSSFGFFVSEYQIIGMVCVLIGLFVGTVNNFRVDKPIQALVSTLGMFSFQLLILCIFQGRFLILEDGDSDAWLLVGFFSTALALQVLTYIKSQSTRSQEVYSAGSNNKRIALRYFCGSFGGIANAASTYLLLKATEAAELHHAGLVFPLFAVATITICNIWGYWYFNEKINYLSLLFFSMGIIIAFIS